MTFIGSSVIAVRKFVLISCINSRAWIGTVDIKKCISETSLWKQSLDLNLPQQLKERTRPETVRVVTDRLPFTFVSSSFPSVCRVVQHHQRVSLASKHSSAFYPHVSCLMDTFNQTFFQHRDLYIVAWFFSGTHKLGRKWITCPNTRQSLANFCLCSANVKKKSTTLQMLLFH